MFVQKDILGEEREQRSKLNTSGKREKELHRQEVGRVA